MAHRVTRRTVLSGAGAFMAEGAFGAVPPPRVEPFDNGGFAVIPVTGEAWRVTAAEVKSAFGPSTAPQIEPARVVIEGALVGSPIRLTLSFTADGLSHFSIATRLAVAQHDLALQRRRWVAGENAFAVPLNAKFWGGRLGLLPASSEPLWLLRFDDRLNAHVHAEQGFVVAPPMRVRGQLRLLPSTGQDGEIARIDEARASGERLFATRGDRELSIAPAEGRVIIRTNGSVRQIEITGGGRLRVGEARLRYDARSLVRFDKGGQRDGQWSLRLHWPTHAQRVSTPDAAIEVEGTGGVDVEGSGGPGQGLAFSAKATLRHISLRLPLTAGADRYADVGRLDFDSATIIRLRTPFDGRGATGPREAVIPLTTGLGTMRVTMDSASLRVARDADMFRATFGFRGWDLVVRRRRAVLEPVGRADGSLLIAILPPQHILEEAFFRVAPTLPGRELKPEELSQSFDPKQRVTLRNVMEREEEQKATGGGAKFKDFYNNYSALYLKLVEGISKMAVRPGRAGRARAPYPSRATRDLEAIYIGPDGLFTPLARQAAREVAEAKQGTSLPPVGQLSLGIPATVIGDTLRRFQWTDGAGAAAAPAVLGALLSEAGRRNSDFARMLGAWRARPDGPGGLPLHEGWIEGWPTELPEAPLRNSLTSLLRQAKAKAEADAQAQSPAVVVVTPTSDGETVLARGLNQAYQSAVPPSLPITARAAGETRLVFEVKPGAAGATFDWALDSLTDWGKHELRVAIRAERASAAGTGEPDFERFLLRQLGDGLEHRQDLRHRIERLEAILRRRPAAEVTAIELPARLLLSPAAGTGRIVRSAAPPMTSHASIPLWHAELRETPGEAYSLRAIHTPDFERADALRPLCIPDALAADVGPLFSLDDADRRQLVILSSLHGLPAMERSSPAGTSATSQVAPPASLRIEHDIYDADKGQQSLYLPRPLPTRHLRLTALGASLDLEAPFIPPAPLRYHRTGNNAFDALTVERWQSRMSLGREVMTEVVYKGFLYPLGCRASLIKVTERGFVPWRRGLNDPLRPVAYLTQRIFIRVRERKAFPAIGQPFEGRAWPCTGLRMLTTDTPDLLDPRNDGMARPTGDRWRESLRGRLDHRHRTGLVFWPRTAPGLPGNVRFRFSFDGVIGNFSMPLVFVDNTAVHDAPTMRAVQEYYNRYQAPQEGQLETLPREVWESLRRIDFHGARCRYAEEDEAGDTTLETISWDVRADSRDAIPVPSFTDGAAAASDSFDAYRMNAALESDDQPPFYPRLHSAVIRHDAVARFSGNAQAGVKVQLYQPYLPYGLPVLLRDEVGSMTATDIEKLRMEKLAEVRRAAAEAAGAGDQTTRPDLFREVFLAVDGAVPGQTMGSNGQRSGAALRPEMRFDLIGRKGPVGTGATEGNGVGPVTPPTSVKPEFVLPEARICGLVSLQQLIKVMGNEIPSPILRDIVEFGEEAARALRGGASELRRSLDTVLTQFNQGPPIGPLLRNAYQALWIALGRLSAALGEIEKADVPSLVSLVPLTLAAGRTVLSEMQRVAVNPIGPLAEAVRQAAENLKGEMEGAARKLALAGMNEVRSAVEPAVSDILRILVPLAEARALLEARLARLQSLLSSGLIDQIRAAVTTALAQATRQLVTRQPRDWPPTLAAAWTLWRDAAITALRDELSRPALPTQAALMRPELEAALRTINLAPPAMLERFYGAVRATLLLDLWGAVRALAAEGIERVVAFFDATAEQGCDRLTTAIGDTWRALIAPRLPERCTPGACPPAEALTGVCARLWAITCEINQLAGTTQAGELTTRAGDLATALNDLVSGIERLPPPPASCTPAMLPASLERLRELQALRAGFVKALDELVSKIGRVIVAEISDDLAGRLGAVLADLLDVLLPSGSFVVPQSEFLAILGSDRVVAALNTALIAARAWRERLRSVSNVAELRRELAQAVVIRDQAGRDVSVAAARALDDLDAAGRVLVAELALTLAQPAIAGAVSVARPVLIAMRGTLQAVIEERRRASGVLCTWEQTLELRGSERLVPVLYIDLQSALGDGECVPSGKDALDGELDAVNAAIAALEGQNPTPQSLAPAIAVVQRWADVNWSPALERILRSLGDRLVASARRALLRLIDTDGLRAALEAELRKFVPSRRRLEYTWRIPDKKSGKTEKTRVDLGIATFVPGNLTIRTEAALDLLNPSNPLTGSIEGSIEDFEVHIGKGQAVLLKLFFSPLRYRATLGQDGTVEEPRLKSFEPGGFLIFLAGLAAYSAASENPEEGQAGAGGDAGLPSGPYVIPRPDGGPGMRAGYAFGFGAIQIGTMAISNVAFDAHAEIPFDSAPGHVRLSLSTPEKPAILSCAPYGGAAHVLMESYPATVGQAAAEGKNVQRMDISFQWGGAADIHYGPLNASARVMTGFTVSSNDIEEPKFEFKFVAAFEGHVACFGISGSFVVTLGFYDRVFRGEAVLTYKFKVGPVDKEFKVRVTRNAGKGIGDEQRASAVLPDDFGMSRIIPVAFHQATSGSPPRTKPELRSDVPAMAQDWRRYRSRFAEGGTVLGRRPAA